MSEKLLLQILNEMQGVKSEIKGMKSEIHGINTEIKGMKQEMGEMNDRLTSIETLQHSIFQQTGNLTEYHTETIKHLTQMQSDIEFTYKKTAIHDLKFNRIENESLREQ